MSETIATEGLLAGEILTRALDELAEVDAGLRAGEGDHAWLVACQDRLDNAIRDLRVVRDRFQKAQR